MTKTKKYLALSFLVAFCSCLILWMRSDLPPYGKPIDEISDNYWGYITHIADVWRTGSFSFWNREAGGGLSLFTVGVYPVLNPTNVFALFLNNDHFYLFKLLEPYFWGIFFMCFLLLKGFNLSVPVAFFGGLAYMGLMISRGGGSPMVQSPQFLFGSALFPAMVYWSVRFKDRPVIAASLVGVFISLLILVSGVTLFPQTLIWWMFFFTIYVFLHFKKDSFLKRIGLWITVLGSLVFLSIAFLGIQFVPTVFHALNESARVSGSGHYPINSFPIFPCTFFRCLSSLISVALLGTDGISSRGILALFVLCVALMIHSRPNVRSFLREKPMIFYLWLAALTYFFFPTIAGATARVLPFLDALLKPMTTFTFAYGIHTLDFCLVTTLCLFLNKIPSLKMNPVAAMRNPILFVGIFLAYLWGVLPAVFRLFPALAEIIEGIHPRLGIFVPSSLWGPLVVAFVTTTWFWYLVFKPRPQWLRRTCSAGLVLIGFMSTVTCWSWFGRGQNTNEKVFAFDSPEHLYFQKQRGKFFLPYAEMPTMCGNYPLMFGIKSTCGSIPVPPDRFNKFLRFMNNKSWKRPFFEFVIDSPSSALATYFPVDFTVAEGGSRLSLPGFRKEVSGHEYDMWARSSPAPRVFFADRIILKKFDQLMIDMRDRPLDATLVVETKDAQDRGIRNKQLTELKHTKPRYSNFRQVKDDALSFDVVTKDSVFVMVPEMFQKGWTLRVDGKRQKLFTAWYLFLGFELGPGEHHIELYYRSPGLLLGGILTLLAIVYLVGLLRFRGKF